MKLILLTVVDHTAVDQVYVSFSENLPSPLKLSSTLAMRSEGGSEGSSGQAATIHRRCRYFPLL
jgi:hypothetical protein